VGQVNVSIDDEHLGTLGEVVEALEARGLQVEHVLDAMGLVTGFVPDEHRRQLASVPGVLSVDGALGYQLPSPDSPVQ
jgi:hypothetical protein